MIVAGEAVFAVATPGGVSVSTMVSEAPRVVPSASTWKSLRTTPCPPLKVSSSVTQPEPLGTRCALRSVQSSASGLLLAPQATPVPGSGRPGSLLAVRAASSEATEMRTPVVTGASVTGSSVYPLKPVPFIQLPPGAVTVCQAPLYHNSTDVTASQRISGSWV